MADTRSKNHLFLTNVQSNTNCSHMKVDRLKTNWTVIRIKLESYPNHKLWNKLFVSNLNLKLNL